MSKPGAAERDSRVDGVIDAVDRRLVVATQDGLPLHTHPYGVLAKQLDLSSGDVMRRLERMLALGVIRRIATVPNHYALGYRANAMTVWDVPDALVDNAGEAVGALPFVSHCYHRPRHPPAWPYNLFAMVHGRERDEVDAQVSQIRELLGDRQRGSDVLLSKRILKKTGLRLRPAEAQREP